jgi:hypothetical protein
LKKSYQKILGVKDPVSPEELKKAFRKKANEFHPDKNPSKDAQKRFIEICEAYKALSENNFEKIKPVKPSESATTEFSKKYNKGLTPEEFEERLQRAREYAKIKSFKEENIRALSYHQIRTSNIRRLHKIACVVSFILITINTLDFLILKPTEIKGQLISQSMDGVYLEYTILDFDATYQHALDHPHEPYHYQFIKFSTKMNCDSWSSIRSGSKVTIYKSYLFDDLLGLSRSDLSREAINENAFRFHLLFWIYLVLLGLPLVIAFTKGPNSFYIISIYLCTYLSLTTSFFYLLNLLFHFNA